ncbi:MAG: HD domain-containing protein, partial [Candidatus Omnitrophota bacterium]|nr:HD domain-containing protein [Candidatus Omnitrophota bacterium]
MVELSDGFGEYEGLGPYRKREKPEELSLSRPEEKTEIGAKSDMSKAEVFYRDVLDFITSLLNKAAEGKEDRINAKEILEHAAAYCEVLSGSLVPDDLVHLVFQHDEYRDNYLYTHSVNVCLVAVRIARELNFSKSAMRELIIASLFHDIGMMKISTDIWNKDGGLSGGEYEEVRKHPARG